VRISSVADGKTAGTLDVNPSPIAQRLADAKRQLADAQAASMKSMANLAALKKSPTTAPALSSAQQAADAAAAKVTAAKTLVDELASAQAAQELAVAQQQLAKLSEVQNRLAKSLAQIDQAEQVIGQSPQRHTAAQQRITKAREANTSAQSSVQSFTTTLQQRSALERQAVGLVDQLQESATKDPQNKSLADALSKARESAASLNANTLVAQRQLDAAAAAAKTATDGLHAAEAEGAAAAKELQDAQVSLAQAKRDIASALSPVVEEGKRQVEQLAAQPARAQATSRP